jgi:hypothetical protein
MQEKLREGAHIEERKVLFEALELRGIKTDIHSTVEQFRYHGQK